MTLILSPLDADLIQFYTFYSPTWRVLQHVEKHAPSASCHINPGALLVAPSLQAVDETPGQQLLHLLRNGAPEIGYTPKPAAIHGENVRKIITKHWPSDFSWMFFLRRSQGSLPDHWSFGRPISTHTVFLNGLNGQITGNLGVYDWMDGCPVDVSSHSRNQVQENQGIPEKIRGIWMAGFQSIASRSPPTTGMPIPLNRTP